MNKPLKGRGLDKANPDHSCLEGRLQSACASNCNVYDVRSHFGLKMKDDKAARAAQPKIRTIRDVRLVRVGSKPHGNKLREFLVRAASARSTLCLPADSEINWDSIGIVCPAGTPLPAVRTFRKMLVKMKYCLNLHESVFAKPGNFARRYEALQAKSAASRFTWSAYLCLHSPEFAAKVLANNLLTRARIVDQLIKEGKDVWDTSFIRTNVLQASSEFDLSYAKGRPQHMVVS